MKNQLRNRISSLIILGVLLILVGSCKQDDDATTDGTIKDIDGNVYHAVTIGTQVWMVENLKTTKYRNGDEIANKTDLTEWQVLSTGAYCDYDNTPSNSSVYGRLYNIYAVKDSRNIAPMGWHIPSSEEWDTLITFLGGEDVAGGKLKEEGTAHWGNASTATNESGFTALPGGYIEWHPQFGCYFFGIAGTGAWWSNYTGGDFNIRILQMRNSVSIFWIDLDPSKDRRGFSVRCLKD